MAVLLPPACLPPLVPPHAGVCCQTAPCWAACPPTLPFHPGSHPRAARSDYLYADEDGVLVSPAPLELPDAQQLAQLQALYQSGT